MQNTKYYGGGLLEKKGNEDVGRKKEIKGKKKGRKLHKKRMKRPENCIFFCQKLAPPQRRRNFILRGKNNLKKRGGGWK